jgi:phytoene synthase
MKDQDKSLKLAYKFARSQTKHYSKSFFISASLLPKDKRWDTFALYNFCRYADNLIDKPRNRSSEELILEVDHFAEEVIAAYKYGESEHPVLKSFIEVAKKYQMPLNYPLELLEGVKMDLIHKRYDTFDDLYKFCYKVAGVVGVMMTYILGYKSNHAFCYAEHLGAAMQLTNILRDVKEDKNMNRIYLPLDELKRFDLTYDDIVNEVFDDRIRLFMKYQIDRAGRYYTEASDGIKLLTPNTQFAISSASRIYRGILLKIEAKNYNPFEGRVFVNLGEKIKILSSEILRTRFLNPLLNLFT